MLELTVPDNLWNTALAPEGILERWRVRDGVSVGAGQVLADLRIEDALHELISPGAGRLAILVAQDHLIEPGTIVGHLKA
jgi:hypothetical protein